MKNLLTTLWNLIPHIKEIETLNISKLKTDVTTLGGDIASMVTAIREMNPLQAISTGEALLKAIEGLKLDIDAMENEYNASLNVTIAEAPANTPADNTTEVMTNECLTSDGETVFLGTRPLFNLGLLIGRINGV